MNGTPLRLRQTLTELVRHETDLSIVVTGAVESPIGKFDLNSRLKQTANSLDSVRTVFPRAKIIYVDSSNHSEMSPDDLSEQLAHKCNRVLSLSHLESIGFLYGELLERIGVRSEAEIGTLKSVLEASALAEAFSQLEAEESVVVAKLSARYLVRKSPRLPLISSTSAERLQSGLTTLRPSQSYLRPTQKDFSKYVRTVFWASKNMTFFDLSELFLKCRFQLLEKREAGVFLDLEHSLFHNLQSIENPQVTALGITGFVASTGRRIKL